MTPPRRRVWNDPRVRAIFFQVLTLGLVGLLFYYLAQNLQQNLETRGIASGFDFLGEEAGFGVSQTLIEYQESDSYGRVFLVGLLNTVLVSSLGIVLATLLGIFVGVARLSSNWLVARLATLYIEIFRNIPLLLQIFFWYFSVLRSLPAPRQSLSLLELFYLNNRGVFIPAPVAEPGLGWSGLALLVALLLSLVWRRWVQQEQVRTGQQRPIWSVVLLLVCGLPLLTLLLTGMPLSWEVPALRGFNFRGGWTLIPEFLALLLALSIYTATFIAEIVRAGILSVSKGQREAAMSLGLRHSLTMKLVIFPQALRVIIPPLTTQYLNLTKNSSLAAAIGYPELVALFGGTALNQTGQAVEVIAMTMSVYLLLSLLISLFMNWYNKKIALVER